LSPALFHATFFLINAKGGVLELKKQKIYLDTSVVSHLQAPDTPEKMLDTIKLWEDIKNSKYEVYISNVTIGEINDCNEPKRSFMLDKLKEIELTIVNAETEVDDLSQEFIKLGILKEKNIDDCMHIATALLLKCDVIVSWNFKHIVNDKTIDGVKTISQTKGLAGIKIYCPSILIGEEMMMNKPVISNNFTVEDIHKIREWHYEQRKLHGKEEYNKKLNQTVTEIIKVFPKAKTINI